MSDKDKHKEEIARVSVLVNSKLKKELEDTKEMIQILKNKISCERKKLTTMAKLLEGSKLKAEYQVMYDKDHILEAFYTHLSYIEDISTEGLSKKNRDIFQDLELIY